MKIVGFSKLGANKTCHFYDTKKDLLYSGRLAGTDKSCEATLFDKNEKLISTICYCIESTAFPNSFDLKIGADSFPFKFFKETEDLYCEKCDIKMKRNPLDKGFKLLSKDKVILSAVTFNLFTDHLSAKYHITIKDSAQSLEFLCTVCMLYFIIVYESAIHSDCNRVNHENPTPWRYI